ncbi:MAG: hypothetical protein Q7T44_10890 [Parvibaculum sp.]|nr:hypothetical protein [Parvibaculum sp.]
MIDLVGKLIALLAELGTSVVAYMWARDRARLAALEHLRERDDAIRKAGAAAPRDGAGAIERLRNGTF